MPQKKENLLTPREQQIMDVVYRLGGEASATEIQENIPDTPSNAGIRTLLKVLCTKGHLTVKRQGKKCVYYPTSSIRKASKDAIKRIRDTFYNGSFLGTVNALLDMSEPKLTSEELDELALRINALKENSKT